MYFVNREQINDRLQQITYVKEASAQILNGWDNTAIMHLAQERALHLGVEIVTDVGSLLIDGFIMRDASSYEDIIEIIAQEGVLDEQLHQGLLALVQLRRPIVQDYAVWKREGIHPQLATLSELLESFARSVECYMDKELF